MVLLTKSLLTLLLWGALVGHGTADTRGLARRGMPMNGKGMQGKGMQGKGMQGKGMPGKGMRGKGTSKVGRPTRMPTPPPQVTAYFAATTSSDFEVVACNETSVVVQGSHAANMTAASYFIYLQDGDIFCNGCSPLFRYVESIQVSSNGTFVLSTRLATAGEIMGDIAGPVTQNQTVEPLVGCSHSGAPVNRLFAEESKSLSPDGPCDKEPCQALQLRAPQSFVQGSCADNWLKKNPDGRCSFTNCFVGKNGDPNDCFVCKRQCDNRCGPATIPILNTDGNFGSFDFGSACCGHDYCWSSTQTKFQCNLDFFEEMLNQCPPIPLVLVSILLPLRTGISLPLQACHTLAPLFFLAVNLPVISDIAFKDGQDKQKAYEKEPVCVAKCPTTQESGGQGTTVLTIDLKVPNGTFPVSYEMYSIPDQLFIEYEGRRIFDTGGLVSGSGTAAVTYSGTTTIIQVTINAPNAGTVWDVFVGCPNGLSP